MFLGERSAVCEIVIGFSLFDGKKDCFCSCVMLFLPLQTNLWVISGTGKLPSV